MKLSILALSLATVIFGTLITTEVSAASSPAATSGDGKSFSSSGKEVFVFALKQEDLQRDSYDKVCDAMPDSWYDWDKCHGDKFSYKKYAGMKGVYTDREPKQFDSGYFAREALLENGETVYVVSSEDRNSGYNNIISLAEHERIVNFKPEKLMAGSKVSIIGVNLSSGNYEVSSQNGHTFSGEEIDALRRIAGRYRPEVGARIADLMSTLKVDYDDFEQITKVSYLPYKNEESLISLKVIVDQSGNFLPALEAMYYGSDWLFVTGYSVSADGKKYDFNDEEWSRDNSSRSVWEWHTRPLLEKELEALESIARANRSVIRFRGKQYFADHELTATQKEELRNLTELVRLLNQVKKA